MKTHFHLAFPVHDFELAKQFYHEQLGFKLGRSSKQAMIFQCHEHQLVAHLVDEPEPAQQGIYPRHFGLIFDKKNDFDAFIEHLKKQKVSFEIPLKTRFKDSRIEHQSFFLKDPSHNLLEFKYYRYPSAIFGEADYQQVGEKN